MAARSDLIRSRLRLSITLPQTRYRWLWAGTYLLLATSGIYWARASWSYDDPFITYRYAENLSRGLGFVFNPGERVLSTTTPLFTVLLALLSFTGESIPRLANLVSSFSIALGAVFLYDLACSLKHPLVGWTGLLLYPTSMLLPDTIGSEVPLYLALCLGCFAFYAQGRYYLTAFAAALAVLTRPDGILVSLILTIDHLLRYRQPPPWKASLLFLMLSLPWFAFAWFYFGSPIPSTLLTKQHHGLMAVNVPFEVGLTDRAIYYGGQWYYFVQAVLAFIGLVFMFIQARRWLGLVSWSFLHFLAYTAIGVSSYFWYYAPLIPGFIALVGLGLTAVAHNASQLLEKPAGVLRWVRQIPYLLSAGLLISLSIAQLYPFSQVNQPFDSRYKIYRKVGLWLKNNTPAQASVGMLEVGIIGYYSNRPIIDFAGLIQPDIARGLSRDSTFDRAALVAVERYHPDYLVLHVGHFPSLEKTYVSKYCQAEKLFVGRDFGYGTDLMIYACDPP